MTTECTPRRSQGSADKQALRPPFSIQRHMAGKLDSGRACIELVVDELIELYRLFEMLVRTRPRSAARVGARARPGCGSVEVCR